MLRADSLDPLWNGSLPSRWSFSQQGAIKLVTPHFPPPPSPTSWAALLPAALVCRWPLQPGGNCIAVSPLLMSCRRNCFTVWPLVFKGARWSRVCGGRKRDDVRTCFLPVRLRLNGGGMNVFLFFSVLLFVLFSFSSLLCACWVARVLRIIEKACEKRVRASSRSAGCDITMQDSFIDIYLFIFPCLLSLVPSKKKEHTQKKKLTKDQQNSCCAVSRLDCHTCDDQRQLARPLVTPAVTFSSKESESRCFLLLRPTSERWSMSLDNMAARVVLACEQPWCKFFFHFHRVLIGNCVCGDEEEGLKTHQVLSCAPDLIATFPPTTKC